MEGAIPCLSRKIFQHLVGFAFSRKGGTPLATEPSGMRGKVSYFPPLKIHVAAPEALESCARPSCAAHSGRRVLGYSPPPLAASATRGRGVPGGGIPGNLRLGSDVSKESVNGLTFSEGIHRIGVSFCKVAGVSIGFRRRCESVCTSLNLPAPGRFRTFAKNTENQ